MYRLGIILTYVHGYLLTTYTFYEQTFNMFAARDSALAFTHNIHTLIHTYMRIHTTPQPPQLAGKSIYIHTTCNYTYVCTCMSAAPPLRHHHRRFRPPGQPCPAARAR